MAPRLTDTNRPHLIAEGGRLTRYGYDLAGRAVVLVAGNGQTSLNTYDALGRLTDRTLFRTQAMTDSDVLAEFAWHHDLLGNVKKQEEIWPGQPGRAAGVRSTTMGYDDNNRLTSETISHPTEGTQSTTYTYDDANNRDTKTITGGAEPGHWDYDYNAANQLTAWEHLDYPGGSVLRIASLTYDDAGNRTSQAVTQVSGSYNPTYNPQPAVSGLTQYTWDSQDRLASVTLPDGSEHRYAYDYRTRRISTGVRTPSSANETSTSIVFSGGLSVAEWEQESGTGLQPVLSAPPTVEYTRGPDMGGGVGGLLYTSRSESASASVSSSRTLRYNLSNGRGDIVAQSDSYASLTWTASYEAYGKRTKETGENKDKQRGNSKDEDPTGLLNEGFRYRDIETGVWLSRDPAGFVDGPNLYAYVQQNPWTGWDPDGLAVVDGKDRDDKTGKWNPAAQLYKVKFNPDDPAKTSIVPVSAKDIKKKNALIWINGISNPRDAAAKLGANHTGSNQFYMIHNPSNGIVCDLGECAPNKLALKTTVATTTAECLRNFDLKTAKIVAHSQGTMILHDALRMLHNGGVSMTGMRTELDGAAANVWRFGRFLKSVGAEKPLVTGHPLDPVHNIVGMNTKNPLRIVGSLIATPLLFMGQKISPHSTKEGGEQLPKFFKSRLFQ